MPRFTSFAALLVPVTPGRNGSVHVSPQATPGSGRPPAHGVSDHDVDDGQVLGAQVGNHRRRATRISCPIPGRDFEIVFTYYQGNVAGERSAGRAGRGSVAGDFGNAGESVDDGPLHCDGGIVRRSPGRGRDYGNNRRRAVQAHAHAGRCRIPCDVRCRAGDQLICPFLPDLHRLRAGRDTARRVRTDEGHRDVRLVPAGCVGWRRRQRGNCRRYRHAACTRRPDRAPRMLPSPPRGPPCRD